MRGQCNCGSVRAVQDARDKAVKWQTAAEEAAGRFTDKDLQEQVQQRLTTLTPEVTKNLMGTPGEVGVVTIAAYRESDKGPPTMVAVAFEGLGDTLNSSFFPRVLSDMPQMARGDKDQQGLPIIMDVSSSGYLIYELDKGDVKASYIPQSIMKQSLGIAIQQSRAKTAQAESAVAERDQRDAQRQAQNQAAAAAAAPASNVPAQQDQSTQAAANTTSPDTNYYGSNGYVGYDGNYYNPYGWSPYLVIPAGARDAERQRREAYRRAHPDERERTRNTSPGSPASAHPGDPTGSTPSQANPVPAPPPAQSAPQSPARTPQTPPAERPSVPAAKPAPPAPQLRGPRAAPSAPRAK